MKKFTRLNSYGAIVLLLFIAITSLVSITSDLPLVPSLPHQQTSYCSTDKEWPHLCCHLVNNCGSHQIFRSSERAGPSPSKTDPSPGGSGTDPTNTWLLGPTQVHTTNSISTGSAVFVWLMVMSNRYTPHRPQNAGNNSVHAMWPNGTTTEITASCQIIFL